MTVDEAIKYARERAKRFDVMAASIDDIFDDPAFCKRNADMLRTLCNEIERLRKQTRKGKK